MVNTIHLVPGFHYDIEYLLPLGAYKEISFANLLEAHRILKKHPEYTYRVEQVYLLEAFLSEYPSLVEDIRCFAAGGRLEINAGMYTMADINMSNGESILRNLITGKTWCREYVGVNPTVLDMGDCIGHPASMPQIAQTAGYEYFAFFRAVDSCKRNSEIRWQGIDGTVIPTYWLPVVGYAGWCQYPNDDDQELLASLVQAVQNNNAGPMAVLPHSGDFKFPYERGLASIEQWNAEHPTKFLYSTYKQGFDAIDFSNAPLETCEWNPSHQGCCSSRIRIKQNNRRCEALLYTAEVISAWAERNLEFPPDADGLLRAWKMTFLNQFHDTIWGTINDRSYQEVLERAGRVEFLCRTMIEDRLRCVVGQPSDTQPVAVFNPLAWDRTTGLTVLVEPNISEVKVLDESGRVLPSRNIGDQLHWSAELPATSLSLFRIEKTVSNIFPAHPAGNETPTNPFSVEYTPHADGSGLTVRTPLYQATFGPGGTITSLVGKDGNVEYVDPQRPAFNALCYQTDRGDLWHYYDGPSHDNAPRGAESEIMHDPYPPQSRTLNRTGKRRCLDTLDNRNGPQARFDVREMAENRLVLSITSTISRRFPNRQDFYNEEIHIEYTCTVTLYADDPQIDFSLETHHIAGKWYRLRTAFFTDITDGTILHEIPFGRFERPEGEFPAQNYIAYYNDNKGIVLLNRGLPGNNVTDGVMMLSLMRSVNFHTRAKSDQAFELGQRHRFDYAIIPFAGKAALDDIVPARRGMEFNIPPAILDATILREQDRSRIPFSASRTPKDASFLAIDNPKIVCSAIYPHQDAIIIRLIETTGNHAQCTITLPAGVAQLEQTNSLLESQKKLDCSHQTTSLAFRPFEIKTLRVCM